MRQRRNVHLFGYIKVEVRSRSPKLWGWTLHRDGTGTVAGRSEILFDYAEDAWLDGQRALAGAVGELSHDPAADEADEAEPAYERSV